MDINPYIIIGIAVILTIFNVCFFIKVYGKSYLYYVTVRTESEFRGVYVYLPIKVKTQPHLQALESLTALKLAAETDDRFIVIGFSYIGRDNDANIQRR